MWNIYHGDVQKEEARHIPHQKHNPNSKYPCGGKYRHIYLTMKLKKQQRHNDNGHKTNKTITIEDFLPKKETRHDEQESKKQKSEEAKQEEKKSKIEKVVTSSYSGKNSWKTVLYQEQEKEQKQFYPHTNQQNQNTAKQSQTGDACPLCGSVIKKQDNKGSNNEYRDAA